MICLLVVNKNASAAGLRLKAWYFGFKYIYECMFVVCLLWSLTEILVCHAPRGKTPHVEFEGVTDWYQSQRL